VTKVQSHQTQLTFLLSAG